MSLSRRNSICALLGSAAVLRAQQPQEPDSRRTLPDRDPEEDTRLPNGKLQKDAISKQAHEEALKEVESLIRVAEDLRSELKRAGEYVVAVSSLRKTEEIEKLARQIRGKLKA